MMKKGIVINYGLPTLYIFIVFFLTFYGSYFWPFGQLLRYGAMALGVVLPIIIDKKFYQTKEFMCFMLYLLVIYMNYLSGDENYSKTKQVYLSGSSIFIALSMTHYILRNNYVNLCRKIVFTTILVLLWTSLATGIFDSTFPGIVRYAQNSLSTGEEDISAFAGFYKMGMSNYMLPHALPMMIPPFVLMLKNRRLKIIQKIICVLIIISMLALLYFSGATGPLLLGIFILALSFIAKSGETIKNVIMMVVVCLLIIPFLMSDQLMLSLLEWIDGLIGGEGYFHGKVVAMQNTIVYGKAQGDFGERSEIYQTGLDIIFENPLWGTQEMVAGHSIFICIFGALGLIGFIPFIAMILNHVEFVKQRISLDVRIYYYIGLLATFLMLTMKGVDSWEIWFASFTLLPLSIVLFSSFESKKIRIRK